MIGGFIGVSVDYFNGKKIDGRNIMGIYFVVVKVKEQC